MNPQPKHPPLSSEELDALLNLPTFTAGNQGSADELSALRSALTDFRAASTAAAEHHQQRASILPTRGSLSRSAWAFATAAVIVVCAATPLAFHHHPVKAPVAAVASSSSASTVSDAVLYANVQSDIDASLPSPMLPLATTSNATQTTTKGNAQ